MAEEQEEKLRLPKKDQNELLAIVLQRYGSDIILTLAEDGVERKTRIPGKMRKRVWIREGDIVIIKLWDFQPSKADVIWRYLSHQVEKLKRMGLLKNLPI